MDQPLCEERGRAEEGNIVRKPFRIGTSGWNYDHWRGPFYPESLRKRDWFSHYAGIFDTVEINSTFYNLPKESTFVKWRSAAPEGFVYAVKANRFLTHVKKLRDVGQSLELFLSRVRMLKEGLGPVLYQLPPGLHRDLERLEGFLALLPGDLCHVFEFRNEEWFCRETYDLLGRHGVSLCAHDMPGQETPRIAVGRVAYVRFHGIGTRYHGSYSPAALRSWASWLVENARQGRYCYAYFNNDAEGAAPRDAGRLRARLDKFTGG